jgi:hypothetical protein
MVFVRTQSKAGSASLALAFFLRHEVSIQALYDDRKWAFIFFLTIQTTDGRKGQEEGIVRKIKFWLVISLAILFLSGLITNVHAFHLGGVADVPFQHDNFNTIATMNTYVGKANGPTSSDRVVCLSCHRAHASGFDSMLRFGLGNEFVTVDNGSGTPLWPDPIANPQQAMGRTTAETQAAYYGCPATVFAVYQRVLCNKCHMKD